MPDTDKSQNELADASTDDGAPRESFFRRIRPLILFLLLAGILFGLFRAFWDYMYVYRIPAGTNTRFTASFVPTVQSWTPPISGKPTARISIMN